MKGGKPHTQAEMRAAPFFSCPVTKNQLTSNTLGLVIDNQGQVLKMAIRLLIKSEIKDRTYSF